MAVLSSTAFTFARIFAVLVFCVPTHLWAQEADLMLAKTQTESSVKRDSWNFFRGEKFDGTSQSLKVADSWDDKGPPIFWIIDLGGGYSGFVGAGERVYTQYQTLTGQFVVCLNAMMGEKVWEHRYDWPYKPASLYPGPRSTPTISGKRIFYTTPSIESVI